MCNVTFPFLFISLPKEFSVKNLLETMAYRLVKLILIQANTNFTTLWDL